MKEVEKFHTK